MGKTEKRFNKWLIGVIIGGAIIGGVSSTKQGKSFAKRIYMRIKRYFGFFRTGVREMKKTAKKNIKK